MRAALANAVRIMSATRITATSTRRSDEISLVMNAQPSGTRSSSSSRSTAGVGALTRIVNNDGSSLVRPMRNSRTSNAPPCRITASKMALRMPESMMWPDASTISDASTVRYSTVGPAEPMRRILHIDMDAFYASVEQRDRPSLRGKPLAVGGQPDQRGVVAAATYGARALGVPSAMSMAKAVRLCSTLTIVRPDFARYQAASQAVFSIFREVTPLVEPL